MNIDMFDRIVWMVWEIDVGPPIQSEINAIFLNYIAADIQLDTAASLLVARMDNRIVAQVMYKTNGNSMSVAGLWVSPSYRNTRAALALVCGLLHMAGDLNMHHIYFCVDEQHTAFYKRLGACRIRGGYEVTL